MAPLTSAKVSNVGPYKNSESRAPSQAGSKETGRKNHKLRNILQSLDQSMESNGSSSSIVAVDVEDENAVVRFLISSRVYGYPNSDGSVMSNYRHFVYNNHPLISIFFAKRGHPYNTKKRFIVYICIICFAIGLSYLFLNTNYVHEVNQTISVNI